MRQDLQYYVFYVALRPDYVWRLILYPYYVKFAKLGDYISFRYIDISIPKYLETGRGGNLIQRIVAITDDTVRINGLNTFSDTLLGQRK